ncbi:MAG: MFS transporter [Syntrophales bacterium]|jgi:MFS family permease|nr:MFS transporter [Syntrophales bacterium]MDD4339915.1 MFS transporter [Syntrophales bacterium]HPB70838.1 MFS transporter [Syntrophales bacterium]HQN26562.1 MFS transporter [Syntrophales bacterium]HQP29076.1 MFS transporter [Syntrophales bacterium]
MVQRRGVFYGWWIVVGGFVLNFIGIGIGINAIGVFFKPVVDSLGFSRGDFSLYFTIAALSMTAAAPLVGKLLETLNVRVVMGVSTALLAVSFALYSQCQTLTHFYLLSVLVGVGHAGSHIIPVSTLISNWFRRQRGLAMGIVFTATGIGGLVFNPVANGLILHYGWRETYILLGALIGVICMPTALLLMKRSPEEEGWHPDGAGRAEGAAPEVAAGGYRLGEFAKTPVFWLLAGMILLVNTLNMGIQQHLIPYLTDIGHSSTVAANIMGLYLGMTVFGKLVLGSFCDRRGLKAGLAIFTAILVVGILLLFGAASLPWAVLFGVVYGFGNAIQTVLPPLMTVAAAGLAHFALIYGIMTIFQTLGSGIGMPLSGYLYDWTGGYEAAFYVYIGLAVLAALLGMAALKRARFKAV